MPRPDERFARLLPDHRTLYIALDEIRAHRRAGETDAEALLRSVQEGQHLLERHPERRAVVGEILRRVGIPHEDPLGVELAKALVTRGLFLHEHPQMLQVLVDEEERA